MAQQLSLHDALSKMQDAVKRGAMDEAKQLGRQSTFPLSLDTDDVQFSSLLSTGAESRVYKGLYGSLPVAIKQPIIRTRFDLERFRQELKIVASLNHPSLISILGARVLPPNYFMVMPLEGPSYFDLLHVDRRQLTWNEIIEIGYQLSGALMHVHDRGFMHRDIKTKNILMGQDRTIKLIDFGIAGEMNGLIDRGTSPSGGFHKRRVMGTLEYMAPEVLQNQGHRQASDVYAFGVTLNEMATGVYPFSDCSKENPDAHTILEMGYGRSELATAVVAEGLRPTLASEAPSEFVRMMERCWKLDPVERPSFGELHGSFYELLVQLEGLKIPSAVLSVEKRDRQSLSPSEHPLEEGVVDGGEWFVKESEGNSVCLSLGSFATAGYRGEDRMEDRHFVTKNVFDCPSTALLGIFDGHRGYETAEFASNHFQDIFKSKIKTTLSADAALTSTFRELEAKFEASPAAVVDEARGLRYPGCTAIVSFIHQDILHVANAGDCRAVLCRNGEALQLSHDHTASHPLERRRIQQSGFDRLRWEGGSWRIGNVGLQVTRSIGDLDLKSHGVCADPEITSVEICPSDAFLIVASDGLWDAMTNEEAVELVHDTVKQPDLCAKRLATEAVGRGSRDNITVLVAFLKPVETLELIFVDGNLKSGMKDRSGGGKVRLPQMSRDEIAETL